MAERTAPVSATSDVGSTGLGRISARRAKVSFRQANSVWTDQDEHAEPSPVGQCFITIASLVE